MKALPRFAWAWELQANGDWTRSSADGLVAAALQVRSEWRAVVEEHGGPIGVYETPEAAKTAVDSSLRELGYRLLEVLP